MEFQVFQMEAQFVSEVRNSRSLSNTIRRNFTKIQKDGKDMMSKEYRMKIVITKKTTGNNMVVVIFKMLIYF